MFWLHFTAADRVEVKLHLSCYVRKRVGDRDYVA